MTTHSLILGLTAARRADLGTIVGTDDIATADEVWAAAVAATAAGLAAGEEPDTIRHRLLAAWRHDTARALPQDNAFVGNTWARTIVAFDGASVESS